MDIMVLETTVTGAVVDRYQAQISLPYSLEYDLFAKSGKALLMSVCSHMEGSVTGDLSALSKIKMPRVINVHDPVVLFAILCGILLLADIAVRKLRWKDIKECYERIKSKWNCKGAKK